MDKERKKEEKKKRKLEKTKKSKWIKPNNIIKSIYTVNQVLWNQKFVNYLFIYFIIYYI